MPQQQGAAVGSRQQPLNFTSLSLRLWCMNTAVFAAGSI
jgi:hypothetical protein